jgi:hypothetical protein
MDRRALENALVFVLGGLGIVLIGTATTNGLILDDEFNLDDLAARPLLALLFFAVGGVGALWEWRQLR